jgi:hypothetical protein
MEFKEVQEVQGYNKYVLMYERGDFKNPKAILELLDIQRLIVSLHATSFETLSRYLKDYGITLKGRRANG